MGKGSSQPPLPWVSEGDTPSRSVFKAAGGSTQLGAL